MNPHYDPAKQYKLNDVAVNTTTQQIERSSENEPKRNSRKGRKTSGRPVPSNETQQEVASGREVRLQGDGA